MKNNNTKNKINNNNKKTNNKEINSGANKQKDNNKIDSYKENNLKNKSTSDRKNNKIIQPNTESINKQKENKIPQENDMKKEKNNKSENKFINNTKQFIKDNFKSIILMIIFIIVVNIEFPYYIEAPGGTINLSKRIDDNYNKKDGSLNMLYVTQYRGNVVTLLLGQLFSSWDIYEISNQQISNETSHEIYLRNKVMLDNSIQNATFVAYQEAGKEITIKDTKNIVIATTKDNGIKIGDNIISVDNHQISNINELKSYLNSKSVGDEVKVIFERDDKEKTINIKLDKDKILGVAMITNYEY